MNALNYNELTYTNNNESRPRAKRFCTRLDENNQCSKRITLRNGLNSIDFQIVDKAGNSAGENVEITDIEISYAFKLILDEFKSLGIYQRLQLESKY